MRLGGSNKLLCAALQTLHCFHYFHCLLCFHCHLCISAPTLLCVSSPSLLLGARISCRASTVLCFALLACLHTPAGDTSWCHSGSWVGWIMRGDSFFMNKLLKCEISFDLFHSRRLPEISLFCRQYCFRLISIWFCDLLNLSTEQVVEVKPERLPDACQFKCCLRANHRVSRITQCRSDLHNSRRGE